MNRKTIYLAGGCYWGVEKYVSSIRGVVETEVGFANGSVKDPSYQQVKHGDTGHAETVRVVYDGDVLPLPPSRSRWVSPWRWSKARCGASTRRRNTISGTWTRTPAVTAMCPGP